MRRLFPRLFNPAEPAPTPTADQANDPARLRRLLDTAHAEASALRVELADVLADRTRLRLELDRTRIELSQARAELALGRPSRPPTVVRIIDREPENKAFTLALAERVAAQSELLSQAAARNQSAPLLVNHDPAATIDPATVTADALAAIDHVLANDS